MITFAAIANDVPTKSGAVWKVKDWVGWGFERVHTTVVFCLPFLESNGPIWRKCFSAL